MNKMNLNYQKPQRTPLDDIREAYKKADNITEDKPSDGFEALQRRYNEDPTSLNPTEMLTLGMYMQQEERNRKNAERNQSVDEQ